MKYWLKAFKEHFTTLCKARVKQQLTEIVHRVSMHLTRFGRDRPPNTACTRSPAKSAGATLAPHVVCLANHAGVVVGVCAFFEIFLGFGRFPFLSLFLPSRR